MKNPSQSQKRAGFALQQINALGKVEKEFANFASGAPAMILQNGLGQALAFWMTKKDKEEQLAQMCRYWILSKDCELSPIRNQALPDLMAFIEKLTQLSQREYLMVQDEVLRYLEWVKRFAKAKAPDEDKDES